MTKNSVSNFILNRFFTKWSNPNNKASERNYYEKLFFALLSGKTLGIIKVSNTQEILECFLVEKSDEQGMIEVKTKSGEHRTFRYLIQGNMECLAPQDELEQLKKKQDSGKQPKPFNYGFQFVIVANR